MEVGFDTPTRYQSVPQLIAVGVVASKLASVNERYRHLTDCSVSALVE